MDFRFFAQNKNMLGSICLKTFRCIRCFTVIYVIALVSWWQPTFFSRALVIAGIFLETTVRRFQVSHTTPHRHMMRCTSPWSCGVSETEIDWFHHINHMAHDSWRNLLLLYAPDAGSLVHYYIYYDRNRRVFIEKLVYSKLIYINIHICTMLHISVIICNLNRALLIVNCSVLWWSGIHAISMHETTQHLCIMSIIPWLFYKQVACDVPVYCSQQFIACCGHLQLAAPPLRFLCQWNVLC